MGARCLGRGFKLRGESIYDGRGGRANGWREGEVVWRVRGRWLDTEDIMEERARMGRVDVLICRNDEAMRQLYYRNTRIWEHMLE